MFSSWLFVAGVLALLSSKFVLAGENDWLSPQYNYFFQFPLPQAPVAVPKATYVNQTTGIPIDFYEITIKPLQAQIYPNLGKTSLVGYDGIVPGPAFKITKGRETLVRFVNAYDRPSAIHLHGSFSRAPFDGWAEDTIAPGNYKDYYYPNNQPARTLWYHDHAVHITAVNAYYGQAGFYILSDPAEEARLGLPAGKYDIPLVIQAKQYASNGELVSPENERVSLYGDVIHVNGQPWPYLDVEPRKYRFRLLDASISRTYHLSLVDGTKNVPFNVIASDAGYLSRPVQTSDLYLSMAERYEIVVDFSQYAGKNLTLKNDRRVMADEDYFGTDRVMQFRVGNTVSDTGGNGALPSVLRDLGAPAPKNGVDRTFRFERTNGEWQINGVAFADVKNRILAKPTRGLTEVWELQNGGGGWSHPVHIHLIDFQIISRSGGRGSVQPYEAVALKDVVLLGTSETVRVIAKYVPWDGVYMFHCHNLVHEDHDMMGAFNVTQLADFGYPETTKFIDPMEERWRDKPYSGLDLQKIQSETLPFFSSLDAYAHVAQIENALDDYFATAGTIAPTSTSKSSTSATSTSSTSSTKTSTSSTTTSTSTSSTSTSTTKSDDKTTKTSTSSTSTSTTKSDDKTTKTSTSSTSTKTSTTKTSTSSTKGKRFAHEPTTLATAYTRA